MSLAKRFLDGFLGKKDKNAEKPEAPADASAAAGDGAGVPAPETAAVETPAADEAGAPLATPADGAAHAPATEPDGAEPAGRPAPAPTAEPASARLRFAPPRPSTTPVTAPPAQTSPVAAPAAAQVKAAATADDATRPPTIRISAPPMGARAPAAAPAPATTPATAAAPAATAAPAAAARPQLRRTALQPPSDQVELPLRALLVSLPAALRGPAWKREWPTGTLPVDRDTLRRQLGDGRVCVPAATARRHLPEGWLSPAAGGDLDLDFAEVLAAVPGDLEPGTPAAPESEPPAAPATARSAGDSAPASAAEEQAQLPYTILAAALPQDQRGPAWRSDTILTGSLPLPRQALLEQLAQGRVALEARLLSDALPAGWVAPGATGKVDLDLAAVVSALPESWLRPEVQEDQDVAAVSAMKDLFAPARPTTTAGSETATAVPRPAAAAPDEVHLPASVVLTALPAAARGPAWKADWPGAPAVAVSRSELMRQLAAGRVDIAAAVARNQLPEGALAADAADSIPLDLAAVVAAVPSDLMQVTAEMDQDAVAVASMRDFFSSTGKPKAAEPPAAPAEPAPAAVPETPAEPAPAAVPETPAEPAPAAVPGTPAEPAPAAVPETPAEPAPAPTPEAPPAAAQTAPAAVDAPAAPPRQVEIPTAAALAAVPAAWRGPAWRDQGPPGLRLALPTDEVLRQLGSGSVTMPVALLASTLPSGWLTPEAHGALPLDLASVVAAVPPDLLEVPAELADDVVASSRLGALFSTATPSIPAAAPAAPPQAAPEAAPAAQPASAPAAPPQPAPAAAAQAAPASPPAAPPEAAPAATPPQAASPAAPPQPAPAAVALGVAAVGGLAAAGAPPAEPSAQAAAPAERAGDVEPADDVDTAALPEWDGVEPSMERAPLGVNLNTARAADLMALPGVGASRAQTILEYRAAHGGFRSIFELAELPGIGPSIFRGMTGLSVRRQVDRHQVIGQLLDLPTSGRPMLERITEAIRAEFAAAGALLTSVEGIPLAIAGDMSDADKVAALGSRYFFRTRRHLQKFVDKASDCIILPGSTPPLLLLSSGEVVAILALTGSTVAQRRLQRVRRAMHEVGWILSRRAVVAEV